MRVIIPKTTDLQSTNITEPLADWDTTTTYYAGEKIYVLKSDYDEIISNGDCFFNHFSSDGPEWTYNNTDSQYDCDGTQASVSKLYQNIQSSKIMYGDNILVQFEVTAYTSGTIAGYSNGGLGSAISATGYYQQIVVAGDTNNKNGVAVDATFVGSVSNISIKKVGSSVQHDIYESQQSQSGNFPPNDDYTNWIRISASNRWKMFDDFINTQTENNEIIQVKLDSTKCDAIALFDVEAISVRTILVENSYLFSGSSFTTLTVSPGVKEMIVSLNKSWAIGDLVEIEDSTNNNVWMVGVVTSYDGNDLTVNVDTYQGAGSASSWNIRYVYQNESYSMYLSESMSWGDYFFTEIRFAKSITKTFAISFNSSCRIVMTGVEGQTVRCGHILVGKYKYLGKTQWGLNTGITDYSTKETNTFGETYLSQGAYSKTNDFDIWVEKDSMEQVFTTLAQLRAIPCAWDANNEGTEYSSILTYGFYDSFEKTMEGLNKTLISINIQGLI